MNELEKRAQAHKKKLRGITTMNPNAGNVEYNVSMFNKVNSPAEGPCNNPISGPFGGDVGGGEAMGESMNESTTKSLKYQFLDETYEYDELMDIIFSFRDTAEFVGKPKSDLINFILDNWDMWHLQDEFESWVTSHNEKLTEATKKETIELEYKDLEFTQYGPQRDVDDWDEWDRCMDWTYEVDKDDLYTFIFESCIDETDFPLAFEDDFDPNNAEDWSKFESWLDDNFDAIYSKYEEKILENWEEDAQEEAASEYDPDDYVDWDSMPGGHDDDRYWEDLNEGEEVFMEKYPMGLTEEYKRELRMIDYFEQMNSEDDEV